MPLKRCVLGKLVMQTALCIIPVLCFAQMPGYLKNAERLPTPTAASLGRYGNTPVNMSTGVPQINVPLYTISTGKLSLPISLSYHASGIRVNDYASWVGLGWSLNAGGVITRVTKGWPDEHPQGYLANAATLPVASDFNDMDQADVEQMISIADNMSIDTEPDIFYYNFNNYVGSFFFGQDGAAHTAPFEQLDIAFDGLQFTITLPNGEMYTFGAREMTELSNHDGSPVYDHPSAWYLSSIKSSDKSDEILFSYKVHSLSMPGPVTSTITAYYDISDISAESLADESISRDAVTYGYSNSPIQSTARKLESISFNNGKVLFSSSQNRQDLVSEMSLDEIQIFYKDCLSCEHQMRKKFALSYFYNSQRMLLRDVTEQSPDGQVHPPYSFSYNTTNEVIEYYSKSQDHWGYYNGKVNEDLIPRTQITLNGFVQELGKADRSADASKMSIFSLNEITYPTGGRTEFKLESNSTIEQTPVYAYVGDRANTDIANSVFNDDTFYTIATPVDKLELYANFVSKSELLNVLTNQGIELKCATNLTITNVTKNNTLAIPVELNNTHPFKVELNSNFPISPGDQLKLHVDIDDRCRYVQGVTIDLDASLQLLVGTQTSTIPVQKTIGGLRIRSIKDFDEFGLIVHSREFTYGSVQQMYFPRYDYRLRYAIQRGSWTDDNGSQMPILCAEVKYKTYVLRDQSISSMGSGSSAPFLYGQVGVSETSSTGSNGKTVYHYSNAHDFEVNTDMFTITLPTSWLKGLLMKEEYFKETDPAPIRTIEYQYGNQPHYSARGLKVARSLFFPASYCIPTDYIIHRPICIAKDYTYLSYSSPLVSKKMKTRSATGTLEETELYEYGNIAHNQLTKITKNESDGFSTITTKKYPHDVPTTPATAQMIAEHQVGVIIESAEYKLQGNDEVLTSKTNLNYEIYDEEIVLRSVDQTRNGNSSISVREADFIEFDEDFNVTELKTVNGIPIALVWIDGCSAPIARFEGATRSSVFYESFEGASGTLSEASPSGLRYLAGTSYTVSTPPIGTNLMMTFWYLKDGEWRLQSETGYSSIISVAGATGYDEVRVFPKGAIVTTTCYKPGVGIVSETDPNNITTYYEYDAFNRLKCIRDKKRQILKNFVYNYYQR